MKASTISELKNAGMPHYSANFSKFSFQSFILAILLSFFQFNNAFAQIPQGFNYQAVIRDANGDPLSNQAITVTFVIADNMNLGYQFYSEEHVNVMTNEFGLVNLVIGEGDVTSDFFFDELNFTDPPFDFLYQLEVNVNIGNGDVLLSESLFQSVPYALAAEDVKGGAWKLEGNAGTDPTQDFIGTTDFNDFKIRVANQERMTFAADGWTGIGISNPTAELHLHAVSPTLQLTNTFSGETINDGLQLYQLSQAGYLVNKESGGLAFGSGNNINMFLDSDGQVGIGTTTPEFPLDVRYNGSGGMRLTSFGSFPVITLDGTVPGSIYFNDDGALEWILSAAFNNSDDFVILNPHDNPQIGYGRPFCLQNQTMNVGIKTPNPEASLHIQEGVDASLSTHGWMLIGNVDGLNTIFDNNEIMARDDSGTSPLFFNADGGNVAIGQTSTPTWQLTVNGSAAKPGGGSWTATSDGRLKENVEPYSLGLEEVMKIEPVTYHYIENTGHDTRVEHVGVIAQEIQKIAPDMVTEVEMELSDGTKGDYLSVDPSAFTYMLINAIQELKKENEELKARIIAIEANR
jgi:hypothetical protein